MLFYFQVLVDVHGQPLQPAFVPNAPVYVIYNTLQDGSVVHPEKNMEKP